MMSFTYPTLPLPPPPKSQGVPLTPQVLVPLSTPAPGAAVLGTGEPPGNTRLRSSGAPPAPGASAGTWGWGGKSKPAHRRALRKPTPAIDLTKAYSQVSPTHSMGTSPHLPRCDAHTSYVRCYHIILECSMYACFPPLPHLPSFEQDSSLASGYLE